MAEPREPRRPFRPLGMRMRDFSRSRISRYAAPSPSSFIWRSEQPPPFWQQNTQDSLVWRMPETGMGAMPPDEPAVEFEAEQEEGGIAPDLLRILELHQERDRQLAAEQRGQGEPATSPIQREIDDSFDAPPSIMTALDEGASPAPRAMPTRRRRGAIQDVKPLPTGELPPPVAAPLSEDFDFFDSFDAPGTINRQIDEQERPSSAGSEPADSFAPDVSSRFEAPISREISRRDSAPISRMDAADELTQLEVPDFDNAPSASFVQPTATSPDVDVPPSRAPFTRQSPQPPQPSPASPDAPASPSANRPTVQRAVYGADEPTQLNESGDIPPSMTSSEDVVSPSSREPINASPRQSTPSVPASPPADRPDVQRAVYAADEPMPFDAPETFIPPASEPVSRPADSAAGQAVTPRASSATTPRSGTPSVQRMPAAPYDETGDTNPPETIQSPVRPASSPPASSPEAPISRAANRPVPTSDSRPSPQPSNLPIQRTADGDSAPTRPNAPIQAAPNTPPTRAAQPTMQTDIVRRTPQVSPPVVSSPSRTPAQSPPPSNVPSPQPVSESGDRGDAVNPQQPDLYTALVEAGVVKGSPPTPQSIMRAVDNSSPQSSPEPAHTESIIPDRGTPEAGLLQLLGMSPDTPVVGLNQPSVQRQVMPFDEPDNGLANYSRPAMPSPDVSQAPPQINRMPLSPEVLSSDSVPTDMIERAAAPPSEGAAPPAEGGDAAGNNIEKLARQVYSLLRERLRVEQERRSGR